MQSVIYSVIVAFFISLVLGPIIIPMLHKLKFGQNIREEGPKSHQKKSGTPSMGGIIFIISSVVTIFLVDRNLSSSSLAIIFALIAFGAIGFTDDYLKIVKKKNEGLKPKQKMILLIIAATALAIFGYTSPEVGTKIFIPFLKSEWELGILFIPFIVIYFAATTNAVNLTDGLDGLSTTITILVMTFFASVSLILGNIQVALFCGALAGALLGFLQFNAYPAKVFMGDTGSLALGGALATIAMVLKLPLLVIIVGGVYLGETLSVIIQVISFKTTGKRVFKMSPIHHHFELMGWHETRVVVVFSIVTIILCLIGFLSIT
ncbi:phospho-N-acetylmuramoyl-pentapeptide-transferase [Clostridium grantii]|uniref:Phospho-N-acetylmuramoyl-pentapeptide-transferase n=1 Tax=Clostridium grantii DSM 8605 TaxID=1121316 RepID=A0A1M5SHS3_9CLOT|nr:phospho-N-acetylmuramoyl-pentapeptide-transferase [Clostridium grantii]SHH38041.1 Phospho-N-acetylmuramoyl-pentapeptide-transferase [Clostridium grantii DSM 8605]